MTLLHGDEGPLEDGPLFPFRLQRRLDHRAAARSSKTLPRRRSDVPIGVGLSSFSVNSAVTVGGGTSIPSASIIACTAVQLLWQSMMVP